MKHLKDKVIVLKQNIFEENHLIIQTLNTKGSKLSFIAKGAKNSKKRFTGGVLEPGHFIGVEYRASSRSALHFLQSAWFLKRFENLRTNYDRLKLALHFLHLIERVSQEGTHDNADLFNLLGNSLKALEHSQDLLALQFIFEYRLLLSQGVLPEELHSRQKLLHITAAEHSQLQKKEIYYQDLQPVLQFAVESYVLG